MTSSWENDVAGTSKERVFLTSLDRHFCQAQVQVKVRWGSWHGPGIILESVIAKLQLNSRLNLHFKSIQLLQELSWSYALYLVFTMNKEAWTKKLDELGTKVKLNLSSSKFTFVFAWLREALEKAKKRWHWFWPRHPHPPKCVTYFFWRLPLIMAPPSLRPVSPSFLD